MVMSQSHPKALRSYFWSQFSVVLVVILVRAAFSQDSLTYFVTWVVGTTAILVASVVVVIELNPPTTVWLYALRYTLGISCLCLLHGINLHDRDVLAVFLEGIGLTFVAYSLMKTPFPAHEEMKYGTLMILWFALAGFDFGFLLVGDWLQLSNWLPATFIIAAFSWIRFNSWRVREKVWI